MALRSLKDQRRYNKYRKTNPDGCGFCDAIESGSEQVVAVHDTMNILRNFFPYSRWDGSKVIDHLMIIPRRHATNIDSLTQEESVELIDLMRQYDTKGYSFYIRSDANRSKSMAHLHGHLILTR